MRALARDPAQRYQSAHDMSEDLDRFLLGRDDRPTSKSVGRWLESIFGAERAALKKAISQGGEIEADPGAAVRAQRDPAGERRDDGRADRLERRAREGAAARALVDELRQPPVGRAPLGFRSFGARSSRAGAPLWPRRRRRAGRPRRRCGRPSRGRTEAGQPRPESRRCRSCSASGWSGRHRRSSPPSPAGRAIRSGVLRPSARRARPLTLEIRSQPPGAHIFVDGSPSGLQTPAVLTGLAAGRSIGSVSTRPGTSLQPSRSRWPKARRGRCPWCCAGRAAT